MPLGNAKFNYVADYPRKDLVRYRPQHDAKNYQKTVQLTFRIEKALADKINAEVFGGTEIVTADALIISCDIMHEDGNWLHRDDRCWSGQGAIKDNEFLVVTASDILLLECVFQVRAQRQSLVKSPDFLKHLPKSRCEKPFNGSKKIRQAEP